MKIRQVTIKMNDGEELTCYISTDKTDAYFKKAKIVDVEISKAIKKFG